MPSANSGTPMARKLSLKDGMRVWRDGMPASVAHEIAVEELDLHILNAPEAPIDAAHIFVTERGHLGAKLERLLPRLDRAGFIWVSWPKRASKVSTDITEDVIRDVALPMHLVDVKVCSVDDIWSGLKLVIRKDIADLGEKRMTDRSIVKAIAIATLISGTLDILLAVILSSIYGKGPAAMLRGVASGPFPGATEWSAAGSVLGLATHFTLMAIMVTVFMLAARRVPALTANPWLWGLIYGLITYVVMNLIVVPMRFGAPLPPSIRAIITQLFAHIVLVGWPTAFIARRFLRA